MMDEPASKKSRPDLGTYNDGGIIDMKTHTPLTWRGDPKDTLSDWKIIVKGEGDGKDECETVRGTYNVHTIILAAGKWRSTYFEAMFKNKSLREVKEMQTRTSTIRLKDLAVESMDAMLDHVYFGKCLSDVLTTSSTVALRSMATYFGIRTLFEEATSHIDKDLNIKSASRYLHESTIFSDDKIRGAAIYTFANNILTLDSEKCNAIVPELFRDIIMSVDIDGCDSNQLSRVVANYCRVNSNVIDGQFLESITSVDLIPQIAPNEYLYFLNLYAIHNHDYPSKMSGIPTTLRDRTMEVFKKDWEKIFLPALTRRIIISGAGLGVVNGTYNWCGVSDSTDKYSKTGKFGRHETFMLFRCRLTDRTKIRWYISIIPKNTREGNKTDIDFYRATSTGDQSELPDSCAWTTCKKNGIDPSPTVTYKYDDDDHYYSSLPDDMKVEILEIALKYALDQLASSSIKN